MKKTISLMLAALMFVTVLSACKENDTESGGKEPTASVSSQDTATTSDNEMDATTSDNEKNKTTSENKNVTTDSGNSNSGTKSNKKEDSKSDKNGDTGSSKVTSSSETKSQPVVINPLPGEKLASKVGFNKNLSAFELDLKGNILIAKSYEEFKEIYDNDIGKFPDISKDYYHFNEEDNYILKYDENFFEENALIVVFSYEPSGFNKVKIDGVSKKDGELFVGVISDVPGPDEAGIDNCAYWRTLIEVKKSDISDITKITRIKSKI